MSNDDKNTHEQAASEEEDALQLRERVERSDLALSNSSPLPAPLHVATPSRTPMTADTNLFAYSPDDRDGQERSDSDDDGESVHVPPSHDATAPLPRIDEPSTQQPHVPTKSVSDDDQSSARGRDDEQERQRTEEKREEDDLPLPLTTPAEDDEEKEEEDKEE